MTERLADNEPMTPDEFATALGGVKVGERNDDGTWTCKCGDVLVNDLSLYMHRRHDPRHKPGPSAETIQDRRDLG